MIHKISIRDLNTLGNQLPKDVIFKKQIQDLVLEAVDMKRTHILFDDSNEVDSLVLEGILLAKKREHMTNHQERHHRRII